MNPCYYSDQNTFFSETLTIKTFRTVTLPVICSTTKLDCLH